MLHTPRQQHRQNGLQCRALQLARSLLRIYRATSRSSVHPTMGSSQYAAVSRSTRLNYIALFYFTAVPSDLPGELRVFVVKVKRIESPRIDITMRSLLAACSLPWIVGACNDVALTSAEGIWAEGWALGSASKSSPNLGDPRHLLYHAARSSSQTSCRSVMLRQECVIQQGYGSLCAVPLPCQRLQCNPSVHGQGARLKAGAMNHALTFRRG